MRCIFSEHCPATGTLFIVMEKGDTDLSTVFKSMRNTGKLTPRLLSSYWEMMLSAVLVLHKEG